MSEKRKEYRSRDFHRFGNPSGIRNSHGEASDPRSQGTSMITGSSSDSAVSKHPFQLIWRSSAKGLRPEALRKFDEIGISQIRAVCVTAVQIHLVAANITEGVVVEYYRDKTNPMLNGGCEFLNAKHKAAVSGQGHHRLYRDCQP